MNNINFYIIKRKFQLMFLIFLSFFVLCFYTCSVINADEIGTSDINTWMPNKKFQSLVLDDMKIQGILSKDSTVNDITQQNMSKLQWISGQYTTNNALNRSFNTLSDNRGVDSYSIEGIQYATNIVALNLDNTTDFNDGVHIGDVTDISPISSLSKLKYIFLRGNRITDVSPIVQLQQSDKNLTYVDVSLNSIYDFKGMQLLPQQGIQETSRLYINGLNVGEGVHNRIMNPTIGEQVAVISDPLKINSENRSTTVNINDIAHLPSTYSISRVANLTQAIPFENIHNYRYVFPYISVSSRGANVNQINNTTFHYSNLPEQVMNPKLRLPGYGVIPLQYKYYIVLHNNDYDDSYYIPYVFVDNGIVHVNYVDANGNKLSDPTTLTGKIGDSYTTSAKDIPGYTLSKEPTNKTGKYSADDINVNYEYTKNPTVTTGTVHVNYVDANGNKLSDPTTLTGKIGDSYTTSAKDIQGYTLSKEPTNKTGKYGADDINVNYEYTKNPTVTTGTVHVNYVDANGNKLSDPTTLTGKIGDSYTTSAKDIPGYTLSKEPTNKTGKYDTDDVNVNYEYTKNSDNDNIPIIVNPSNHDAKNSDNNNIPHNHFRIDKNKTSKYHGLAICSIKYINMYSGLNNDLNNRSNIVASYIKKTRIKYPMFVVKGVYSYENREYYKVVDVNHKSKTNGLIGYITANKHYVIPAYLKSHTRFITVINPYGVYSSSNVKLNNNLKKYNQGSILKINGIVKHNLTTRYVLPNGNYITGNCRLIELGKRRIEKQIKLKKNVYLYKDMNLTHKLRMLKRGRTYNLRYYDYSYRYDFNKTGFKIYLIKGGYIKADSKAIKITKRY
ncbi:MucBP domain-containing protein [Apilactobacillus xinyiensis]|uniref:MucBP domain-containing protein n=1 Tax=Apilactobacillus xinyiensis TaxID=2841032 RepID=UPI002010668D|nr:MucBP domain-containing protein [Apilactobacillus xinyiensis]MCL0330082.1 MucBP domain-containing protein [Apilactobacillus xinyiensis]